MTATIPQFDATDYRPTAAELSELAEGPLASSDYRLAAAIAFELRQLIPHRACKLVGDPREDRESLSELALRVRPAAFTQEPATRAYDHDTRTVHVAIVGACRAIDLQRLDECLALCDQVRALWGRDGALRTKTIAAHDPLGAIAQSPLFDEQALLRDNLFVGTLAVTYVQAN